MTAAPPLSCLTLIRLVWSAIAKDQRAKAARWTSMSTTGPTSRRHFLAWQSRGCLAARSVAGVKTDLSWLRHLCPCKQRSRCCHAAAEKLFCAGSSSHSDIKLLLNDIHLIQRFLNGERVRITPSNSTEKLVCKTY